MCSSAKDIHDSICCLHEAEAWDVESKSFVKCTTVPGTVAVQGCTRRANISIPCNDLQSCLERGLLPTYPGNASCVCLPACLPACLSVCLPACLLAFLPACLIASTTSIYHQLQKAVERCIRSSFSTWQQL